MSQEVNKLHSEQYFFEQYYQVYSKHYTYEELRAINDFFASDVGKKFIGIRGALHQDVSKASIKMIHRLVDQFSPKVKVSLAKSGYEVEL